MSPSRPGRPAGRGIGRIVIDTRPLRVDSYRYLWTSTMITAVGGQFSTIAVPKQLYDLTGSSAWVGMTGAVGLVALVVFGLWGGAIADAVDRRQVIVVSNIGIAVTSGLLWAQAWTGLGSTWVVLALFGMQQACVAVNSPARNAMVPRLVPLHLVVPATALSFTTFMIGLVVGPLAAGALLPVLGLPTLYLIDTVALCLAIVPVLRLPATPPDRATPGGAGVRDIVDGFRYLVVQRVLLASFLIDIIAMVAGMPRALFPEMAERTFGDPPGGGLALGWLYAAIPLGAVLCGLLSGVLSRLPRQGVVVTVSVIAWGLAITGFGLSSVLWLAVVLLALAGAADLVSAVHRGAILQTAASDEMRGRMQGAFMVVVAGGPRIADLVHGWAGSTVGTSVATAAGGLLVVVLTVVAVACLPAFWRHVAPDDRLPGSESSA